MASLSLDFEGYRLRIATDSRTAVRHMRRSLEPAVQIPDEDVPLGFVLKAPRGSHRLHELVDRGGFVLSRRRGLRSGIVALESHLSAFSPSAPGTVRFRCRSLVGPSGLIIVLAPLMISTIIDDSAVAQLGLSVVDRLAVDLDVTSLRVVDPHWVWLEHAHRRSGRRHYRPLGGVPITRVIVPLLEGSARPTDAQAAAMLSNEAVSGTAVDVLAVAKRIVNSGQFGASNLDAATLLEVCSSEN